MVAERLIAATVLSGLVGGLVILWPERILWTNGGAQAVEQTPLEPVGRFPIELKTDDTIIVEGDSLVTASRLPEGSVPWPKQLETSLEGPALILRGRGGHTAAMGAQTWAQSECGSLAIILYGANDAAVRGWFSSRSATGLAAFERALGEIIARHQKCNSKVLVLGPLPPGSAAMAQRLEPYREAAREVALAHNAYFLDPCPAFASHEALLHSDGLHLSREGQAALAKYLSGMFLSARP